MTLRGRVFVFAAIALVALLPGTAAQFTNATCLSGFDWMTNSRQQSPCLVSAYLSSVCLPSPDAAHVDALPEGTHYAPPVGTASATPCRCNTVFYSTLQACAVCQGQFTVPWTSWSAGCNGSVFIEEYPKSIPAGTAIPAWAFLDVTTLDNFNATAAELVAASDPQESSASAGPAVTSGSASASASAFPTGNPQSNDSSSSGHKSNAGPIAGGVIGGLAGLAIIAGSVWWFLRRRQAAAKRDVETRPSGNTPYDEKQQALLTGTSPPPQTTFYTPQPDPGPTQVGKLYDPNDPSTFPSASPEVSLGATAYNPQPYGYPNAGYAQAPGKYSGVAEL